MAISPDVAKSNYNVFVSTETSRLEELIDSLLSKGGRTYNLANQQDFNLNVLKNIITRYNAVGWAVTYDEKKMTLSFVEKIEKEAKIG